MVEEAYRSLALQDFRRKREKLALDSVRLGKISTIKNNINNSYMDVFEEGYATKEMNKRNSDIITRKEELELRKKKLNNLKRQAKKISTAASNNTNNNSSISLFQDDYDASFLSTITTTTTTNVTQTMLDNDIDLDLATEAEVLRAHLDQLKRDETALAEEKRLLDSEKAVHIKELKRCQCEERSRFFHHLPTLNQRYLLQSMLGRGGFSEVWKAFDLIDLREVAVKIHQLNPQWPDEKKASYIKHVTREYSIHREMKHPRVVELYDVFEIDMNSFATVLEYCKGIDLDEK
jgi:tousled-like kinase